MTADEERIRDFAYQIWESEGRPADMHDRHWEMARKLVEAENQEAAKPTISNRKVTRPTEANLSPDTEIPPAATSRKPRAPRASAAKTNKEPKDPNAPKAPKASKPKAPKSK